MLRQQTRRAPIRVRPEGTRPPKNASGKPSLAYLLLAEFPGRGQTTVKCASRELIAVCGSLRAHELSAAYVQEADHRIWQSDWAATSKNLIATSLRRILRWLWEEHGSPKLDQHIRRYPAIRPRSVTIERDLMDRVLDAVPDHIRLWLLLCSDLAIRSGTAAAIGPAQYNRDTHTLRFTTKKAAKVNLPVTIEIRKLIERCDLMVSTPFVRQLWPNPSGPKLRASTSPINATMTLRKQLRECLDRVGITNRIIPHDMRRTAAVGMLEATGDIRDVQALLGHRSLVSTIWYLDHDLRPVKLSNLELIKNPNWRKEKSA